MKLKLKDINKNYDNVPIVNNIVLEVQEGELVSILGPSGSGKTTILKMIAGLVSPDKGCIYLDGKDITHVPANKRGISYVFQNPLLFPHMTVFDNIAFGLKIKKVQKGELQNKIKELLKSLQLEGLESRMPAQISGGQQQRVAIARALAITPKVLLMDEPFSSLDPQLRQEMGSLIRNIQNQYGLTIIFVTHDRNEGISLSDKAAVLLNHRILQIGSPLEVYYHPKNRQVSEFLGPCNYIPGLIRNDIFYSHIGNFQFKLAPYKDCKKISSNNVVTLLLRPHLVKITPGGTDYIIINHKVIGKEIQYHLRKGDLFIISEHYSNQIYRIGDRVGITVAAAENAYHFFYKDR